MLFFFKLPHPCPHHISCDVACFERSACASATFLFSATTRLASSTAASSAAVLGRQGAGGVGKDSNVRDAPTSSAPGGGGDVVFPSCGNVKIWVREPAGELMLVDACRRLAVAVRKSLTPLRHEEDEAAFYLPDLLVSPFSFIYVVTLQGSRPAAGRCRGCLCGLVQRGNFVLCFAVFYEGSGFSFGKRRDFKPKWLFIPFLQLSKYKSKARDSSSAQRKPLALPWRPKPRGNVPPVRKVKNRKCKTTPMTTPMELANLCNAPLERLSKLSS